MGGRYRIRVSGQAQRNPDVSMLAQIVILIGRRLRAEQLRQQAANDSGPSAVSDDE